MSVYAHKKAALGWIMVIIKMMVVISIDTNRKVNVIVHDLKGPSLLA